MNQKLKEMLEKAENIRINHKDQGAHARILSEIAGYAIENNLFTGNPLDGTANEDNLSFGTEWAAGILEFNYGETIGSVINLTMEKKIDINKRAAQMYIRGS